MNRTKNSDQATVVVWGLLASMPFGGMIWQVFHYMEGLRRLGFDVWYVEDSENPCMHPQTWERVGYYHDTVRFLDQVMKRFDFRDRWVFRPPGLENECLGALDLDGLHALYEQSEVVFNLCGANRVRPEHATIKRLALLQTDPVAPQIDNAAGNERSIQYHARHGYHFTYAENIGTAQCLIPDDPFEWIPTRPPIVTDWWTPDKPPVQPARMTTIANWDTKGKDAQWKGQNLRWDKSLEFQKLIDTPSRSPLRLELSLSRITDGDRQMLEQHGWLIDDAKKLSDGDRYREYIMGSLGEFTVAKEQYVLSRSGWFSDRSACYLAAGRPVITQDTGFGDVIPEGMGLLSFSDAEEAVEAIKAVHADYEAHARAALELSREYFEAETVMGDVMRHLGLL